MSAYNPFRANPLSPTSTGASVNTVTSYNPPPSFHSVARDDETTVYFDDVDELPVITEESEGSELSRSGTMMSSGTWRGEEETGTRTPTRSPTPLIDLDHSLPPTPTLTPRPEITIQIEEPELPSLPLSPRSTGSRSRSGTTNRAVDDADDNVDFPAPQYPDDLPPAYTPAPDFNHGEETLEVGPRRPFQQVRQQPSRTPNNISAPTPTTLASTSLLQADNASPSPAASFASRSLNRGRRGRLGAIQQWTEQIFEQLEQVTNTAGVGNLRSSSGAGALSTSASNTRPSQGQVPRHARSFSDFGSRTGGRLSPVPPPLPARQSPNQTGGSTRSANSIRSAPSTMTTNSDFARDFYLPPNPNGGSTQSANSVNTRSSAPASTTTTTTTNSDFARDFYLSPNPTGGSTQSSNTVNTHNSAPASTTTTAVNSNTSIPSTANSDFARDFYAAGTGEGILDLDPSSSDDDDVPLGMRRTGSSAGPNTSTGDVRSRSFEALQNAPGSGSSGSNGGTDDDSRPTTQPVPGRALLKDGKILVYPKGFTCPKCFNIGYKRSDPKNPCKKCWKKYAKPYSPVMSYAPDSGATNTLQRPLPKPTSTPSSLAVLGANSLARPSTLRRPQPPPQHALHRASPSVPNLHASQNTMPGSFPSSPPLRTTPTGCNHPFHSRGPSSPVIPPSALSYLQPQQTGGSSAVVYSAGDPRLGGRRCWQCGGTGRVSYLFFDNSMCMECSGIGRVYS